MNGTLLTLGLVGAVAAAGALRATGSRAALSRARRAELMAWHGKNTSPHAWDEADTRLASEGINPRAWRRDGRRLVPVTPPKGSRSHGSSLTPPFSLLHRPIRSQADAKAYLRAMVEEGYSYHLDDDARDIVAHVSGEPLFTPAEAKVANQRMEEVFQHFSDGDPYDFVLSFFHHP